jgi:purine-binding chemotaxis protein CheW
MIAPNESSAPAHTGGHEFVTFRIADQWLGIPVVAVQEVLMQQRIARVPLAPPEVEGFLNLRGQIVTAVCLRTSLGLPAREPNVPSMNVVVREDAELFSLIVDDVGDVVNVSAEALEPPLPTLGERWKRAVTGVVRREDGLLVVISAAQLLKAPTAVV